MNLLLIEDDDKLASRTSEYLQGHGAQVERVADGQEGLERAEHGQYDVVLLDLMLPTIDGLDVCRRLRAVSDVPVIMLSARGEEVDRIVGLEIGADDYLAKPYSPRELLARIRAVLRRGSAERQSSEIDIGSLHLDRERRLVTLLGTPLTITAAQFDLLWVLADQAPRVVSRAELHRLVAKLRGETPTGFDPTTDRSIDVHLSKIRVALGSEDPRGTRLVRTVRGVGYVLDDTDLS